MKQKKKKSKVENLHKQESDESFNLSFSIVFHFKITVQTQGYLSMSETRTNQGPGNDDRTVLGRGRVRFRLESGRGYNCGHHWPVNQQVCMVESVIKTRTFSLDSARSVPPNTNVT